MTGTPDARRTLSRKLKDHNDNISQLWRKNSTGSGRRSRSIGSGPSSIPVASSNFIKKDGDTVIGALGWSVNTIIIASDEIDIAPDDTVQRGRALPMVLLQPESGTTDDLVTITGAKQMQQELWVRGVNATVTITIKNSGNIQTPDGLDFDIVGKRYYKLIYDIADEAWALTAAAGAGDNLGDHLATQPVDLNGNTVILDLDGDTSLVTANDDLLQLVVPDGTPFAGFQVVSAAGSVEFENFAATVGEFLPMYQGRPAGSTNATQFTSQIIPADDTGTTPAMLFQVTQNDNTDLATRPAFQFYNRGTLLWQIDNDGTVDMFGNALQLDADGDTKIQAGTDDVIQITIGPTPTLVMSMSVTNSVFLNPVVATEFDVNGGNIILNANGDTHISATASTLPFQIDGTAQAIEFQVSTGAGSIHWPISGHGHSIQSSTTALTLYTGASTDAFTLNFGGGTDRQTIFQDNAVSFASVDSGYLFESIYNQGTPADDTTIALYQWNYKNSVGTIEPHAEMAIITTDVTNGTEDADFEFRVMQSGTLTTMVKLDANLNEVQFSGGADLDLQAGNVENVGIFSINGGAPSITGSRGGNAALASLLTELENLGLISDNTT